MLQSDIEQLILLAEADLKSARYIVSLCQKNLVDAETFLIEKKLHWEKLCESLRTHKITTPIQEATHRELEIKKFQQDYPELVELAKERDRNRK